MLGWCKMAFSQQLLWDFPSYDCAVKLWSVVRKLIDVYLNLQGIVMT